MNYAASGIADSDRPSLDPPNPNGPTIVGMAFFVNELNDINAVRDDYGFTGYVRTTWCDPRLAFDKAEAGTLERVSFGNAADQLSETVWVPSGFPVARVGSLEVSERILTIHHDGTTQMDLHVSLRVAADFDLRRFPFDRQRLELPVESFVWSQSDLIFVPEPGATDFKRDFSIPEWRIERVGERVESAIALRSHEPFSRIVLEIDIARKSGFYLWKILLPLVVIVALSWSIFWMSDERAAVRSRITSTGVLTIVAYQFVIAEDLPRVAYLTLLDKIMILSFMLLAVAVLQSIIQSMYQSEDMPRAVRIDRVSRVVFPAAYLVLIVLLSVTAGR